MSVGLHKMTWQSVCVIHLLLALQPSRGTLGSVS